MIERIYRVHGMRRAGQHAVIQWIMAQTPGVCVFFNDLEPGTVLDPARPRGNPLDRWSINGRVVERKPRQSPQAVIFNLEDREPTGLLPVTFAGASGAALHDIRILRDPYNLFASRWFMWPRLKAIRGEWRWDDVPLWKSHARAFLEGATEGGSTSVAVEYNRWARSQGYRARLARQLGLEFTDAGKKTVAHLGSTFDDAQPDGGSEGLAVGERWRQTAAVAGFAELFRDRELTELSERIFGRIVNPEDILRFAAAAPPADERRAEALLRAGRLGEARFESTRLVHAMPGEARHWRRLLTVRAKAGRSGQDDVRLCALQLAMMNPEDYRNWYTLGVANFDAGLHINAIEAFREVLVREPDHEPSRMGRAHSLMALGRNREAENDLRAVLEHSPGHLTAVRRLARLVKRRGDPEEAVRLLQSVCTGTVDSRVGLFADLANLQRQLGDLQACRATVDRILEHDPDNASALACLGRLLVDEPDGRSAVAVFERRAQLHPDDLPAHLHLGHARLVAGDPEGAIRSYDAGLAIRPADAQANWNRAWPLLLLGRYEEGWKAYEWRFAARMAHPVCPLKTQWKGEPLDGRRILVWGEQGAGDTIQFLRFARVLKEAGAIVKAMVPPELNRLFTSCPTLEAVYSDRPGKDEYDTHCALGGLPGRLGVRLEDLGPEAPWLAAPASPGPELVSAIDAAGAGLRAGLCWSGNILFAWNHKRSIDPAYLTPLTGAPGVRWFGLQKEAAGAPVAEVCARLGATDLSPWFTDFADTATALSRLDLVITVDTAVAHLAGALGRPVWLLLGFAPDWRWLLDRDDTPWYPAMRLFRQREPGDWAEVIERVRVALQEVLSGKATLATSR